MNHCEDLDFLRIAYQCAENSPDLSTQNGAVILSPLSLISSAARNDFPPSIAVTVERLQRPEPFHPHKGKYAYTEHAERFAIYNAARDGVQTSGRTMYCPWFACVDCARAIICAGIAEVVGHQQMYDKSTDRWKESIADALAMLDEAGVKRRLVSGKVGGVRVRFDGEYWEP